MCAPGGRGRVANSPHITPADERPIAIRDHGRGRVGLSPDGRFGETSRDNEEAGFGVGNPQGSPPKAKPRILHSEEGLRPHPPREACHYCRTTTASSSFPRVVVQYSTVEAWRHSTVAPAAMYDCLLASRFFLFLWSHENRLFSLGCLPCPRGFDVMKKKVKTARCGSGSS